MQCYILMKESGKGAYGTIWKAVDQKMNQIATIKKINKKFLQLDEYLNVAQVRLLKWLIDQNIVTLYNVRMDINTLYAVHEYLHEDHSLVFS